jgi:hypothetical protein
VLDTTSPLQGGACVTAFTWKGMANYVRRREKFIGNSGPQNEKKKKKKDLRCGSIQDVFIQ